MLRLSKCIYAEGNDNPKPQKSEKEKNKKTKKRGKKKKTVLLPPGVQPYKSESVPLCHSVKGTN